MNSKARKLLRRMQKSTANWKPHEVRALYRGCGFVERQGRGSHLIVTHPNYKSLRATIPIHGEVPRYVVSQAIENIDTLQRLQDTLGNEGE